MLLLRGQLAASIRLHVFAPIFLLMIVALVLAALLPKSIIQTAIYKAEVLESQTGLTVIILGGLILYWLARLLLYPTAFVQLFRG
jgi:hypothetical protein